MKPFKTAAGYYDGSLGIITPRDMQNNDSNGAAYHPFWTANFK